MKLSNVVRRFHTLNCVDAYDPTTGVPFRGALNVADDAMRDSITVARRVLSVIPGTTLPTRGVILVDGINWILGTVSSDYFRGAPLKDKYVAHQSEGLAAIKSFDQVLSGSGGINAYSARVWVKDEKELRTSSDVVNQFDLYFSLAENVTAGMLVGHSGRWHIVRATYLGTTGILVASAEELPEPVQVSVAFNSRIYDPLTDTYTNASASIPALRIRWQSHFRYLVKESPKYQQGDIVILVLKSAVTPKAGDKVTVIGDDYVVSSANDEGLCWSVHLRNV